jgi:hypothetical protein
MVNVLRFKGDNDLSSLVDSPRQKPGSRPKTWKIELSADTDEAI